MNTIARCSEKEFYNASDNGTYNSMEVFGDNVRGFNYKGNFYYKNFSRNVYYKVVPMF